MVKKFLLILLAFLFVWRIGEAKIIERVVAKVNNDIITLTEFEAAKQVLSNSTKIPLDQIPEEATREILSRMIESMLVLQEAKRRGIEASSSEIGEALDKVKARFKSEEEFQGALIAQGYTIENLREDCKEEILRSKLISQEVRSKIQIAPEKIEEIKNRLGLQLHAKHILVKTEEDASVLLQRLKEGAGFEELAKEQSLCPSREKGGDLGFFARREMVKEFDEAAFALEDGQISGIVKTQFGYHIIKVVGRRTAPEEDLSRLEKEAAYFLWEENFKKRLSEWLKHLYDKAYIEVML